MRRSHEVAETNFADLTDIVRQLAQAQVRTETRLEELAQAQARTEARLETLTARVDTLAVRMEELAQAQARTEVRLETLTVRMEELAQAQLRTEDEVARLRRSMEMRLGGLGARWGAQTEEAFRNAMKTILEEVGFTAKRYLTYDTEGEVFGRPDQIELDVVIRDGKVIVVEIKSSLDREQVHLFSRKVAFYARKTGQQVARQVIVTSYTERGALELAEVLGVEICTDVSVFK
jgi:hypothetical protein